MSTRFDKDILKQPRWIVAVIIGVLVSLLFVRLGVWQLDRLAERREVNATIESRAAEPDRPLEGVLGQHDGDVGAMKYRHVSVEGVYRTDEEFFSIGRAEGDIRGTLVATPMDLDDGTVLIVVRGLVPPDTQGPPARGYAPPSGRVIVEGRIDDGERSTAIGEPEPDNGKLTSLSRLDLSYIDKWIDGDVLPVTLLIESQSPSDPGSTPIRVAPEELTEGSHLGYAVQWFAFALIVAVGVGVLVYRAGTDEPSDETEMDRTSQM
ncbi:MAG: SURF1 family protein [Actinomycetia bacterium]|nr:SURF1 family protein [Actinomycetes bacterium]